MANQGIDLTTAAAREAVGKKAGDDYQAEVKNIAETVATDTGAAGLGDLIKANLAMTAAESELSTQKMAPTNVSNNVKKVAGELEKKGGG